MPLEDLLDTDHQARVVWDFVAQLDLSPLYARIRAVEGGPGRPAIDPRILTVVWLYATLEGVGSARALSWLCENHNAFRWLVGGVAINYHTLSDFRVDEVDFLDRVLTHSVAVLREQDLVDLNRVAQDGMLVRASAGAASFHRRRTLEELSPAQARARGGRAIGPGREAAPAEEGVPRAHPEVDAMLSYFTNQSREGRMDYAPLMGVSIPIGSGVTEAACKVLVKQRLCGSGMKWKEPGAAAVLSLRCLTYTTERWSQFWGRIDQHGFPVAA